MPLFQGMGNLRHLLGHNPSKPKRTNVAGGAQVGAPSPPAFACFTGRYTYLELKLT